MGAVVHAHNSKSHVWSQYIHICKALALVASLLEVQRQSHSGFVLQSKSKVQFGMPDVLAFVVNW